MIERVEERAAALGHRVLNLDVRDTQRTAILLFETMGYTRWGTHPAYARVRGRAAPAACSSSGRRPSGRGRSTERVIGRQENG